jgi:predicted TIM-barrel fold metal-dependent hydrolase
MTRNRPRKPPLAALLLMVAPLIAGAALPPLADVHTHYKWSQQDVTSPTEAVATLREHGVALAVVIGTPAETALELAALDPARIVPVWSPYRIGGDWSRWAFDKGVPERAREALATGRYHGIGELHLIGGFVPDWRSPVISGLIALGIEHDVPLLLHTEFSRNTYLLELCRAHPRLKVLWAHAGAILPPAAVDEVMAACPNVWTELAARDPWRFVNNPTTGEDGALLPAWRALLERYPDRFMVGSDPVWPVEQLDSWDEPDTGWQEYARFINFHRQWLDRLPSGLAEKIRLRNACTLFGRTGDVPGCD